MKEPTRSQLPSRDARKKVPPKQRIAQLEEHIELLTRAVLELRDEVERFAKRPLLRSGPLSGGRQ